MILKLWLILVSILASIIVLVKSLIIVDVLFNDPDYPRISGYAAIIVHEVELGKHFLPRD